MEADRSADEGGIERTIRTFRQAQSCIEIQNGEPADSFGGFVFAVIRSVRSL